MTASGSNEDGRSANRAAGSTPRGTRPSSGPNRAQRREQARRRRRTTRVRFHAEPAAPLLLAGRVVAAPELGLPPGLALVDAECPRCGSGWGLVAEDPAHLDPDAQDGLTAAGRQHDAWVRSLLGSCAECRP